MRLSAKLATLDTGTDTTVGTLIDALGSQAFGAAIFVFAAPNLVPNPPGTSPILGIPLLFLSSQLLLGRERLWLPQWVRRRSLSHQFVSSFVNRIAPLLARLEHLLKPRHGGLVNTGFARRMIGLATLPLAAILLLPLPFVHILPGAAVALLAAGLAERDGLAVAVGYAIVIASLAALIAVGMAVYAGVVFSSASWLSAHHAE